ncbi:AraC family transcriptional regulator [Aquabacterium sp.]|uniref:AraC family transcriptional regulator n=1 Tax=Aquabacterium sp. TaxID=1872578 RepID=UPI003D6D9EB0
MNTLTPSQDPHRADGWVSMRHLQRATLFARGVGIGVDELLAQAGLNHQQLADLDGVVSLRTIESMLSALQRQYSDPLFGLRLANEIQPSTLGAFGHVLQACPTFSDLVDVVTRYNGLLSNIGKTSVTHSPGQVELHWDCLAGSPLFRRHASEYVVGTFVVLSRLLAPGHAFPTAVHFKHARPDHSERIREYFSFFQCPVHFGQASNSIMAPAELLQLRLPYGDAVLMKLLEQHASNLLQQRSEAPSFVEDVRRLLKALILAGTASKETVAQQLGTSPRSLHRRLQALGTTYRELLDTVRTDLAREQLANITPISEIGERLGFSSRQAFMRWFRQVTGATPSQYRKHRILQRLHGQA